MPERRGSGATKSGKVQRGEPGWGRGNGARPGDPPSPRDTQPGSAKRDSPLSSAKSSAVLLFCFKQRFPEREGDGGAPGCGWRRAPMRPSLASLTLDGTEGSRGSPGSAALRGWARMRARPHPDPDPDPWASRPSP